MPSLAAKQTAASKAGPFPNTSTSSGIPSDPRNLTVESLEVLHRFLVFADPDAADLLPLAANELDAQRDAGGKPHATREVAIADWNVLYSSASASASNDSHAAQHFTPTLSVRAHPDPNRNLFSVRSTIPGVSARQFWSLMSTAENRKLWDSTVEEGTVHRWLAQELHQQPGEDAARLRDIAEATAARVELFRFGSIFMVAKARDMVLLSVDARLPSAGLSGPTQADAPLRLVSTSCYTVDPSLPPRKGYTRFPLQVGGFMVEDLGDDGLSDVADTSTTRKAGPQYINNKRGIRPLGQRRTSSSSTSGRPSPAGLSQDASADPSIHRRHDPRGPAVLITQVSDLGEMAAWVPASVVKMVASTLVPRSIASIGKVAKTMQVHHCLYESARVVPEGLRTSQVYTVREKLSGGGEWYSHRRFPTMIGTGCLRRPQAAAPADATDGAAEEFEAKEETAEEARTEGPSTTSSLEAESRPTTSPSNSSAQLRPAEAIGAGEATLEDRSPVPTPSLVPAFTTPPPRTSSLPGTPSGASNPQLPTSPLRSPRTPHSPSKSKPGLSIDLLGLNPLSFTKLSVAASPYVPGRSPGMYSDSDAGLDDMMSSISGLSTPGRIGGKAGRRFDLAFSISPSDGGTETVPGSVAASELEEFGMGDYLSKGKRARDLSHSKQLYGLTNGQLARSDLALTPRSAGQGEEPMEELQSQSDVTVLPSGAGPSGRHSRSYSTSRREAGSEPLPFVGSFSPSECYRERALSLSPAARRANLHSQELLASEPRSAADKQGAKELDRHLRRVSRALVAEMEKRHRRQLFGSADGSSASETHPANFGTLYGRRVPSEDTERPEPKDDIIDLLAETLSQSLPMAQIMEQASGHGSRHPQAGTAEQERLVKETARSVSAMVLAGSNAFAMALAPGARESLALGFDGLSTTSDASEPRTPAMEDQSPVNSVMETRQAGSSNAKRFPIGLGPQLSESSSVGGRPPLRRRKPSVNSTSRSISVSNAFAKPETTTTVTHAMSRSYMSRTSTFSSNERDSSSLAGDAAIASSSSLTPPSGHSQGPSTDTTASRSDAATDEHLAVEKLKALKAKHVGTRRSVHLQRIASRPGGGSIAHRKSTSATRPGAYAMVSGLLGMAWSSRAPAGSAATAAVPAGGSQSGVQIQPTARALTPVTQPQSVPCKPPTPLRASYLSTSSASPSNVTGRPGIPAKGSVGRLKSRQNYRIDNNVKLHPFPGSLGQAQGRNLPPIHASDEQARRAQHILARSSRCGAEEVEGDESEEWIEETKPVVPARQTRQAGDINRASAAAPPPSARGWLGGYWSSAAPPAASTDSPLTSGRSKGVAV